MNCAKTIENKEVELLRKNIKKNRNKRWKKTNRYSYYKKNYYYYGTIY